MKAWMKGAAILCVATAAVAAEKLTERELKAQFYYDLGPERIDVSAYPPEQQATYQFFVKRCSQCHTLARPINSPMTKREQWSRFIERMHKRIAASSKDGFTEQDEKRIIDFLVYDARRRKIDNADFTKAAVALKARFEDVKAKRPKQLSEDDQKKVKSASYENAQPSPRP